MKLEKTVRVQMSEAIRILGQHACAGLVGSFSVSTVYRVEKDGTISEFVIEIRRAEEKL